MRNQFSQCWSNIDKEIIEFVPNEFIVWQPVGPGHLQAQCRSNTYA